MAYTQHTHIETIIEFQIAVNRRNKTRFFPYVLVLLLRFFFATIPFYSFLYFLCQFFCTLLKASAAQTIRNYLDAEPNEANMVTISCSTMRLCTYSVQVNVKCFL